MVPEVRLLLYGYGADDLLVLSQMKDHFGYRKVDN